MTANPSPETDRAAWLAARRSALGASDTAAVCGLSPWSTALRVWLDKRGMVPDAPMTEAQRWGLLHEPAIALEFQARTGIEVFPSPGWVVSKDVPHLGCTPDRLLPGVGALEMKTARTAEGWGPDGSDEVPEHYLLQAQHQMFVLGVPRVFLAALIGGSDFRVYELARHERLIDQLLRIGGAFWRDHVEKGEPPAPDWSHPATPELVGLLNRPVAGRGVELGPDAAALADDYARIGAEVAELGKAREFVRARLIEALGDAAEGLLPDGRRVLHVAKHRKGYTVEPSDYTELRIRAAKSARVAAD